MTLDEMIDAAKSAQRMPSDNALNYLLGFKGSALSMWRCQKALPTADNVVKLAQLAGVDPEQALLERSIWIAEKNKCSDLIPIYKSMMYKLKQVAATFFLLGLLLPSPQVDTKNVDGPMHNGTKHSIHYATLLFRLM